jgi:hypothetical protein
MKRRPAPPVALVVLFLVGACGHKGAPLAPELVRPEPAQSLSAMSAPEGVRVSWLRPLRYSGGQRMNDLGGFTIERALGEGEAPAFGVVGKLELTDQTRFRKERRLEWVDATAERGHRYLYRVTAYTLDGYRSAPAGPVAVTFGTRTPATGPQ